jgi:hypothetical protein
MKQTANERMTRKKLYQKMGFIATGKTSAAKEKIINLIVVTFSVQFQHLFL